MYIDKSSFSTLIKDKEIYVFGTGIDAEALCRETNGLGSIEAFIDNYRFGENRFFLGKHIISIEQFFLQKSCNAIIVVASYRFAKEICAQLDDLGLVSAKDYYVWDDNHLFCHDENTRELIRLFDSVWKRKSNREKRSKILIPFDNRHYTLPIKYAYCANYFAQKYDASIVAYFRFGASIENASDVMKDIYSSFNVEEIIDSTISVGGGGKEGSGYVSC